MAEDCSVYGQLAYFKQVIIILGLMMSLLEQPFQKLNRSKMILFYWLQNLQQIYLISQFAMKNLFLLLIIATIAHAHIYSSPPGVTYAYSGTPLYYSLFFSLETGIGPSDYLRIIWPEQIHNTNKNQIVVNLISFSNNLQVATATCVDQNATLTTYHVTLGYTMTENTWYEVQVYPSKSPAAMPISYLVQLMAVSDYGPNNIIYDSNMAFGYVDILPSLSSAGNLLVVCNSSSSQANIPAAIYSFDIYLTPSVSSSNGGNFSISIYYDNTLPLHTGTGTSIIDFSFMGLCQSAATSTNSAAVLIYCKISSDLSTITFAMSSVTAGQAIRISTSISNPVYHSVRGIKAYWTEFISGRVMDNGLQDNALQVNKININTVTPRVLLFWGIESSFTDSTITTPLPVFSAASATPNILVYNSFNIGFSFTQSSPITGQYVVYMTLGATGVAQGSIAHNLPAYTGTTVYCYYDTTNKWIVCKNVGAFINTNFRYFISGKAFFAFGTTSPIATFGAVSITPIAYTSSGTLITTPVLYNPLAGQSINVQVSQQFLDLSGYHNTNSFSIGNAQVVSYYDDLSLSSTANAVQGFLQGTNSSIGIIPDLGTSQQLLFLLNTPTASVSSGSVAATSYTVNLMFNSQVISFETSGAVRGLDFVGYLTSTTAWSISGSPCYFSAIVCQKYNNATPTYNRKSIVSASASGINFYGMYNFQCGTTYSPSPSPACSSNCASQCTMFTGYGLSNKGTSLMSMRQVVLPSGFHTSLYADTNVLDFLFTFKHGSSVISYCLINGFTMSGAKLQNIKAAYVNYYDNSINPFPYNKGVRVPMMVRIGGGILPAQSDGATAIGIFFDDNVDASTFYTSTGNSWDIGCSTGSCSYFQNKGVSNTRTDNWILNRQVIVYSLPPIQNEFNILVPVTPDATNRNPPKYLTIAFFSQNYTVWGVSNLLRTVAVYRLFGPVVTASVSGALGTINSLARTTSTPNIQMSASSFAVGSSFSFTHYLNTTNMYSNINNNTFVAGNTDSGYTFGAAYGAGYTITSFFYNIFASSTLSWSTPPANTATTCTVFGYVYNQASGNAYKNKQWIYVAFCPIDSTFNLASSAANINFINPQYPLVFTNNYPLAGVMTIAYSSQNGALRAYRHQTTAITTLLRNCTTAKLQKYNPSSSGKQRSTFTLTIPAITMSATGYQGYSSFRVVIDIPSSTVSGASFTMLSTCDTSNTLLNCAVTSVSSFQITVKFSYASTGTATITYLEVNLYATAASTFSTAASYTVTVYLPQYISSIPYFAPFGDDNYGSTATYCQCQSSFIVGITAYGQTATFNALTFSSSQRNVRSKVSFNFGASSYRDAFFSTSTYLFSFGFLTTPCSNPYQTRSNFRCLIYEGQNVSSLQLSSAWKSLTLTNFASVTLTPKAEISNPSSIIYQMNCFGGGIPTGSNTGDMTIAWRDGGSNVQTASNIAWASLTLSTAPSSSASLAFNAKRFNTQGMKALYSLRVSSPVALNSAARFYFDFHMILSPYLDQNGVVECYIRTSATIDDVAAKYTYCAFTTWWQLMVWNNQANIAASSFFYVDIYNIDLPKSGDVGGNQVIGVTIDTDGDYSNGVSSYAELTDSAPSGTTPTDFYIISTSVSSNYILSTQNIQIKIDMLAANTGAFTTATSIYLLFPASYAVWNYRSQTIPTTWSTPTDVFCSFNKTGDNTNLATSCTFISQRILKISLIGVTYQYYTLALANINTPASIPSGKFNQYRFKLFVAGASENTVTYYTFTDYSQHLTLDKNPSLISLSWNYYSLSVASSLFTLTPLNEVITVRQGYYSNVIELRQSIYPSNFRATMQLAISNYPANFVTLQPLTVNLGKPTAYFSFAATAVASPGLYTLKFSKSGDTKNVYTNIPPLTLVVQNTLCSLTTNANTYTLPIGGQTLPIIINAIRCIPTVNITFAVTFSANSSGQFTVNNDLSNLALTSSSVDGQIYIIIKHTVPASGSLVAGNSVTATISISGANAVYYAAIPTITLTLVDPTTFQTFPTGTALNAPTISGNKATFQLQCSQSSRIYWGIGLYPSILNNAQVDFQARIISAGTGLSTNFTQSNDYYARVYGVLRGTTMQVISHTLYHLQSNVNYIFKYFCVNQLGHVSDSQSINFTTSNYGAYLMKVEIIFRGSITYGQYNSLACSLAQNFLIPYTRVVTQAMSSCGNTPYILYSSDTSVVLNQADSNGWYIYGFYIEPDYTNSNDQTNANIRNQLSLSTQATTIITSTANYINLPSLVQMQTTDIQIYTTPQLSISAPVSGLTSVAVTASITNMNGFIVMGVMQGAFNSSTMTIPSTSNIKSGKFSSTQNLLAVQMIHTTQNYNTSFQFSGLSANTIYTFFYFCTVQDPIITALSSSVGTFSAQTLQMLVININYSPQLTFVWMLALVLFAIAF